MNEKEVIGLMSGDVSPYALITSLMSAAAVQDSKLTKEQKEERAEIRRKRQEERVRQAKIIKNICPDCEGKLIRGKKEKKNDYKRSWKCAACGNSHLQ